MSLQTGPYIYTSTVEIMAAFAIGRKLEFCNRDYYISMPKTGVRKKVLYLQCDDNMDNMYAKIEGMDSLYNHCLSSLQIYKNKFVEYKDRKPMTLKEVEIALGYKVEIIEETEGEV